MLYKGEIYVFESKNYAGWIFGNAKSKQWTQSLNGKHGRAQKNKFYNPIIQNENHVKHLKRVVGGEYKYNSIVVFSDKCEFKNVDSTGCSSYVTKRVHVLELVRAISKDKMDSFEMTKVYSILYPYAHASQDVKKKHIEDVNSYKNGHTDKKGYVDKNGYKKEQPPASQVTDNNNHIDDLGRITSVPLQYFPKSVRNEERKVSTQKRTITLIVAIGGTIVIIAILSVFSFIFGGLF